jgi:hypothetical protein
MLHLSPACPPVPTRQGAQGSLQPAIGHDCRTDTENLACTSRIRGDGFRAVPQRYAKLRRLAVSVCKLLIYWYAR